MTRQTRLRTAALCALLLGALPPAAMAKTDPSEWPSEVAKGHSRTAISKQFILFKQSVTLVNARDAQASGTAIHARLQLAQATPTTPQPSNSIVVVPAPATPQTPTSQPAPSNSVDPGYTFSARRSLAGDVVLLGQVPADPALQYFAAISDGDAAQLSVAPGAPANFTQSAEAGLRALLELDTGDLGFSLGRWTLRGQASEPATRDAIAATIAEIPGGDAWTIEIGLVAGEAVAPAPAAEPRPAVTPTQPDATPAPAADPQVATTPPAAQSTATAAEIAACSATLAEFSGRNAILFNSGAAVITTASAPALDELAADLSACPDAVVNIEGHTDTDGDDQQNLALSVARAEAVVAALIARGVLEARLYAVGYGESAPIADNETAEGKSLNRRIVVTVSDEAL